MSIEIWFERENSGVLAYFEMKGTRFWLLIIVFELTPLLSFSPNTGNRPK